MHVFPKWEHHVNTSRCLGLFVLKTLGFAALNTLQARVCLLVTSKTWEKIHVQFPCLIWQYFVTQSNHPMDVLMHTWNHCPCPASRHCPPPLTKESKIIRHHTSCLHRVLWRQQPCLAIWRHVVWHVFRLLRCCRFTIPCAIVYSREWMDKLGATLYI